ncbi:MAG: hypothetical protein WDM81_10485 [Rhizomicrobium sp.]
MISSSLTVGTLTQAIDAEGKPMGEAGAVQHKAFTRFADDLAWWTEAARVQRAKAKPPY